jgi:hypothetical protein
VGCVAAHTGVGKTHMMRRVISMASSLANHVFHPPAVDGAPRFAWHAVFVPGLRVSEMVLDTLAPLVADEGAVTGMYFLNSTDDACICEFEFPDVPVGACPVRKNHTRVFRRDIITMMSFATMRTAVTGRPAPLHPLQNSRRSLHLARASAPPAEGTSRGAKWPYISN